MSQVGLSPSGMERSIHEMLKDAPSLNDSDTAVQSGTTPPLVSNNHVETHNRPATMNLVLGSPTSNSSKLSKFCH